MCNTIQLLKTATHDTNAYNEAFEAEDVTDAMTAVINALPDSIELDADADIEDLGTIAEALGLTLGYADSAHIGPWFADLDGNTVTVTAWMGAINVQYEELSERSSDAVKTVTITTKTEQ